MSTEDTKGSSPRIRLARPETGKEEIAAVRRVLDSGFLVQGAEVAAFEQALAEFIGAEHVIAVSSGTAALDVLFRALELPRDSSVFIPSFAWPSAANVARLLGLMPTFVDVDSVTCNLHLPSLETCLDEFSSASHRFHVVVAVHQFGLPCQIDRIHDVTAKRGLILIEDAACALGASFQSRSVGCFGLAGIFSFHPRKSITTGEGGAIITSDADLARQCRALRDHGRITGYDFVGCGLNYRMTELQAAIGRVQLTRLPAILQKRRQIAETYAELLAACPGITTPLLAPEHTWQTYMVVLDEKINRDEIIRRMRRAGIETGIGSLAAHLLPQFQNLPSTRELPNSQRLFSQGLALPMHSLLSSEDLERIGGALRQAVASA